MIKILRLGHRAGRDDRISTHVALTARQWGADKVVYSGQRDKKMMESTRDIIDRWGGNMELKYNEEWRKEIKDFVGLKVHLTMYGLKLENNIGEIKEDYSENDLLIVVGSEKVPKWVYNHVDYNLSIGNQPHSEIAALAVFMDRINERKIKRYFEDPEIEVEPSESSKISKNIQ